MMANFGKGEINSTKNINTPALLSTRKYSAMTQSICVRLQMSLLVDCYIPLKPARFIRCWMSCLNMLMDSGGALYMNSNW